MSWEITENATRDGDAVKASVLDGTIDIWEFDGNKRASIKSVQRKALLIAAAPELLEALEKIMRWVDAGCDLTKKTEQMARAAIAKAKGGAA